MAKIKKRKPFERELADLIKTVDLTAKGPQEPSRVEYNPHRHLDRKLICQHMYEMMVFYKSRVNWQIVGQIALDSLYKGDRVCDEDYDFFDHLLRERRFHDKYVELLGNDAGKIVVFEA